MENTSTQNKLLIPIIIGFLVIGAGAFYGGTVYAKKAAGSLNGRNGQQMGQFRMMNGTGQGGTGGSVVTRGGMMGGFTNGEIISKDETSLTVKLMDGGSKIIFLSASTTVAKTETGSLGDLTTGTNVMVMGSANDDGSLTANSVQIRPAGTMPMMTPPRQ